MTDNTHASRTSGRNAGSALNIGIGMLIGLIVATWYHTLNGIRHLAWDAGRGYSLPEMYRSGYMVLVGTAAMSGLTLLLLIIFWLRA